MMMKLPSFAARPLHWHVSERASAEFLAVDGWRFCEPKAPSYKKTIYGLFIVPFQCSHWVSRFSAFLVVRIALSWIYIRCFFFCLTKLNKSIGRWIKQIPLIQFNGSDFATSFWSWMTGYDVIEFKWIPNVIAWMLIAILPSKNERSVISTKI